MLDKQKLDSVLNQPMSRRVFLRNIGLLVVSVVGLGSALNILATGQARDSHSSGGLTGSLGPVPDFGVGRFGA